MNRARPAPESVMLLAGAGVLAVWSFARLPSPRDIFRPADTPFDRTDSRTTAGPAFHFLTSAARVVPAGVTAVAVTEPRDADREGALHGAAVALLPGRRLLPGAQWGAFTPEYEAQAEYVLVLGPPPAASPGTLLFQGAGGSVWKRRRP
ncbi:MAG: hypothetical protein M3S32_10635 [Acidobacteriota bacterium]|nr:hypothetical protein [Acidobacteriota bacterium]